MSRKDIIAVLENVFIDIFDDEAIRINEQTTNIK